MFFFFKQKTAYEMRISDWSSDVCSSDLLLRDEPRRSAARRLLENPPEVQHAARDHDHHRCRGRAVRRFLPRGAAGKYLELGHALRLCRGVDRGDGDPPHRPQPPPSVQDAADLYHGADRDPRLHLSVFQPRPEEHQPIPYMKTGTP